MQLIIGAAQFGVAYGITNVEGTKPCDRELTEVLNYAYDNKIDTIDTADGYGDANARLIAYHANTPRRFKIINKILRYPVCDKNELAELKNRLSNDLKKLDIDCFHVLMFHYAPSVNTLINTDFIQWIKDEGISNNVGLSINGIEEYKLLQDRFKFDVIQLPFNILNQRIITEKFIQELITNGCRIHARSIFLQGLIVAGSHKIPTYLLGLHSYIAKLEELSVALDLPVKALCLAFVLSTPGIDKIVVGVQNLFELQDLLNCYNLALQFIKQNHIINWAEYACADSELIDPNNWVRLREKCVQV